MRKRFEPGPSYSSPHRRLKFLGATFPSLFFYCRFLSGPVFHLCRKARHGGMDDESWIEGSAKCADLLEESGVRFEIDGIEILKDLPGPYVVIANHMSTLETFVLPALLRPYTPITYVVKRSLVDVPFFGYVMRSRDPVTVGRTNPREDLEAVLNGGHVRLRKGVSIIVFPQSTRSYDVNPANFNSIGIKLARRAGVPALPIALKTDAWANGRRVRELGRIRPFLPVRIRIGTPLQISGNGKEEHSHICSFISDTVTAWQKQDGVA